jgi:hypothetical protein
LHLPLASSFRFAVVEVILFQFRFSIVFGGRGGIALPSYIQYGLLHPGMPKKTKKSKSTQAAKNDNEDDDFDKMLAEVTAADPQHSANNSAQTPATVNNASNSSSSSSSSGNRRGRSQASMPGVKISDMDIIDACKKCNITQLQLWSQQGVQVKSVEPLIQAVFGYASLEIIRCLVKDLGADVNWARSNGGTALYVAA